MPTRPPHDASPQNRFLARLPDDELRRLRPLLEPLTLTAEQTLCDADGPIRHVYFPTGSVSSGFFKNLPRVAYRSGV